MAQHCEPKITDDSLSDCAENASELSLPAGDKRTGETRSDRLVAELQIAIVRGEIAPGTKISEADLAAQYGVSRGPLREALRKLESRRLLTRAPHVGARVVSLSYEELLEIYRVREALEGMAARLAAAAMSDDEIAGLYKLLEEHEKNIEIQQDSALFQKEGDVDFHYRIIQGSHNKTLIDVLGDDLYYLVRLYRYQFTTVSNRTSNAIKEHYHIVEAIEARDGELAEILMRRHVGRARENIEKLYKQELANKP